MATISIEVLAPSGVETYTVGVDNVVNINVHFYFANVVYVIVFYEDGTQVKFYQCPTKYTITP